MEDITAPWLTSILQRRVRSVDVILSKELPTSTVHRLAIDYRDFDGPRTLFLKLCRPGFGGEGKEVEFYTHIAPRMSCPPLVKCYDATFSEGHSHILMEDLFDTHDQPEQKTAPSVEMSRRAVQALANAHASWWGSPIADRGSRIADFEKDESVMSEARTAFDEAWLSKFVEDLGKSVAKFSQVARPTPAQTEAYRRMLASAERVWGQLLRRDHLTVTHGDMHWWNFLFPKDPSGSVHIIDWHLWHIDLGARDLAFLLALGGFAEPRPEIEDELLHVYHDALEVADYSWEMLNEDYRWSAIRNLNIPVIFWSQGKHYSTWQDALRRAYESYERLGCAELIS